LLNLNVSDICSGFRQLLPISVFVMIFGAAFGLAAVQAGVESHWIVFMSAMVFAGAAQFATLDLWGPQVPLIPLIVTIFAINARHLLMGATLYPWLRKLPLAKRYGSMLLVSDANWAMSHQALTRGQPGLDILVGGGIALWTTWTLGTWLGVAFGGAIQNPTRWGFDMVMGCFLLTMVVGGQRNVRVVCIWLVAGVSSLAAYRFLPENSHVVVGALPGGAFGALWMEERDEH
jgi:predicted branched-subunit amino acid permease